jgi:hypothetical protein
MENPLFDKIVRVEPRQFWPNEERNFSPWLAEDKNIRQLSDILGIDLEVIEKEKAVGDFELDIFACDKDNPENIVIIENQLEGTDHTHLGQLLTYAAGLNAKTVVWIIAGEARDEHKVAIDWINQLSYEKVSFFLIRIEVLKIGDSNPGVQFIIECAPSEFSRKMNSVKPKQSYPSPRSLIWQDTPGNEISVFNWREVYRTALEKFLTIGGHIERIPPNGASKNAGDFSKQPVDFKNTDGTILYADANAGASVMMKRMSKMFGEDGLGKGAGFLKVLCDDNKSFNLP